ncbi:PEP-CTERM sorting domain-containing protein [Duganella sp. FT135W]|uniref:PEP-CTERM sorting domain-containing protein n=1 Tax=Duganella flavida TaxID=2692175 RepID=A0A6L8K4W1_9BURK|nr:PEP-CTERM sorting domain-containing protein [Duganella flavida]MYM22270.1 PEP-CTERM sorting domain-containing protein [Duganella flavida]
MKRSLIAAAALALTAITSAHAATITGLKNTGLGVSGANDTNYSLSSAVSSTPVITYDAQWPIGPWMSNDTTSKWITPTASQGESFDPWSNGTYTYSLSFDLTGFNAASAAFSGRLAADNSVVVKLNNNVIGSASGFTNWTSFGASSGFVAGVNTLDFVVTNWAQNGGNPTGLRVEFGSSSIAAVPEPETYAMLLGGLAMVGAFARRRKQQ